LEDPCDEKTPFNDELSLPQIFHYFHLDENLEPTMLRTTRIFLGVFKRRNFFKISCGWYFINFVYFNRLGIISTNLTDCFRESFICSNEKKIIDFRISLKTWSSVNSGRSRKVEILETASSSFCSSRMSTDFLKFYWEITVDGYNPVHLDC
jgi:hypothetical protein